MSGLGIPVSVSIRIDVHPFFKKTLIEAKIFSAPKNQLGLFKRFEFFRLLFLLTFNVIGASSYGLVQLDYFLIFGENQNSGFFKFLLKSMGFFLRELSGF